MVTEGKKKAINCLILLGKKKDGNCIAGKERAKKEYKKHVHGGKKDSASKTRAF